MAFFFEHAQSARRRSPFNAIPQRPLAMPLLAGEMLAIILRAPQRSAIFLDAMGSL